MRNFYLDRQVLWLYLLKNNGNQEILIPLDALFEDNGSNVYLFKNGIAVKTAVEIGELRETDKISIVKGLKKWW